MRKDVRDPLDNWRGQFGAEYMERNQVTPEAAREAAIAFERVFQSTGIREDVGSILEVGANIGVKLAGLRQALGPDIRLSAVEPHPGACAQLRENRSLNLESVVKADAYHLPLPDRSHDLVMTNGVLIHIPPDRLAVALREICRAARRYVFCSEYFSHTPVEISYRGHAGMLWKRDFGLAYLENCPELQIVGYGFLWQCEFPTIDNQNWWLFKKKYGPGYLPAESASSSPATFCNAPSQSPRPG